MTQSARSGETPGERGHRRSLILGALLAPLIAPLSALAMSLLLARELVGYFPVVAVIALAGAYLAMLVVGLPSAILLRRAGRLSVRLLCITAAVAGAMLTVGLGVPVTRLAVPLAQLKQAAFGAGVAVPVALAFCVLSGIGSWYSAEHGVDARP